MFLQIPFRCSKDEECERGRYCVRNPRFSSPLVRACEVRPRRCSDHRECGGGEDGEECIETLVGGFNGPEWSSR